MSKEARWLGQKVAQPRSYQPELLTPLTRRRGVTPGGAGEDIWNAYELCWRQTDTVLQHRILEFRVPTESPCLVESKSLKLYLNGLEHTVFGSEEELSSRLQEDLGRVLGQRPLINLMRLEDIPLVVPSSQLARSLAWQTHSVLRNIDADVSPLATTDQSVVLYSDAMKSNCPVTAQPDWASVFVALCGRPLLEPGALQDWLENKRGAQDFHETCVESLYDWVRETCPASQILVYARYTRRGGIDINPWRASSPPRFSIPNWRLPRQ